MNPFENFAYIENPFRYPLRGKAFGDPYSLEPAGKEGCTSFVPVKVAEHLQALWRDAKTGKTIIIRTDLKPKLVGPTPSAPPPEDLDLLKAPMKAVREKAMEDLGEPPQELGKIKDMTRGELKVALEAKSWDALKEEVTVEGEPTQEKDE